MISAGSTSRGSRGKGILGEGGSNWIGNLTGPLPSGWALDPSYLWFTTRADGTTLVNTAVLPNNPGVSVGLLQRLRVRGITGVRMVDHGAAGDSLSTLNSTRIAQGITHCATAGVRPAVVVIYAGSVDAGTPALRDATYTSASGICQKVRTAFGGGTAVVFGGLHTPDVVNGGWNPANEGVVNDFLRSLALDHKLEVCGWFDNQDAVIQGGGSNHLSIVGVESTADRFADFIAPLLA